MVGFQGSMQTYQPVIIEYSQTTEMNPFLTSALASGCVCLPKMASSITQTRHGH